MSTFDRANSRFGHPKENVLEGLPRPGYSAGELGLWRRRQDSGVKRFLRPSPFRAMPRLSHPPIKSPLLHPCVLACAMVWLQWDGRIKARLSRGGSHALSPLPPSRSSLHTGVLESCTAFSGFGKRYLFWMLKFPLAEIDGLIQKQHKLVSWGTILSLKSFSFEI